jgi:hypothetical protein
MVTQARRSAAAGNPGTFRSVNDEADIHGVAAAGTTQARSTRGNSSGHACYAGDLPGHFDHPCRVGCC